MERRYHHQRPMSNKTFNRILGELESERNTALALPSQVERRDTPARVIVTRTRTPKVSSGAQTWKVAQRSNCYNGHGGSNVDLHKDNNKPVIMDIDRAKQICVERGHAGFTY